MKLAAPTTTLLLSLWKVRHTCNGNVWNLTMGAEIQMQVQNRGTMGIIDGENHKRNRAYPREGKVPLMDGTRGQQELRNCCNEMTRMA